MTTRSELAFREQNPNPPKKKFWQTRSFRAKVSRKTNDACFYCGSLREDWTLEHLIPRSLGGRNGIKNVFRCCGPCNSRRGSSPEIVKFMTDLTYVGIARQFEHEIVYRLK